MPIVRKSGKVKIHGEMEPCVVYLGYDASTVKADTERSGLGKVWCVRASNGGSTWHAVGYHGTASKRVPYSVTAEANARAQVADIVSGKKVVVCHDGHFMAFDAADVTVEA